MIFNRWRYSTIKTVVRKSSYIKRFGYSSLGSELKKLEKTEKQHQILNKIFSSNKDNKNVNESLNKEEAEAKILTKKKYNMSNLIYNKSSFYSYADVINLAFLNQNIHIY